MNDFRIICTGFLLFLTSMAWSQTGIDSLVREGIVLHDQGAFDEAIAKYEEALKLDSSSALVLYELGLSYFGKGEYQKAIDYSDIVLEQRGEYLLEAYLTKGSALDVLGQTSESVTIYEKAIEEHGGHYLLYYNLALNYYKLENVAVAEDMALNAIAANVNHPSSHYLLAAIHNQKGNAAKSILSTYYFLFLEPNSARSPEALEMLDSNFGRNVSKDENDPNQTNIQMLLGGDDDFRAVELMISFLKASELNEENMDKPKEEIFVSHTKSFFEVLSPPENQEQSDIWWSFYQPFYSALSNSGHLDTFCRYITQSSFPGSKQWLDENQDKLSEFAEWLKTN